MKKILCILILTLTVFSSAVSAEIPEFKAGTYNPNGELITVTAKGLVCEFCAKALEKVFLRQEEVSGINVNLTTKEIIISLKDGQTLDDKTVEELIVASGYNIDSIKRGQGSRR